MMAEREEGVVEDIREAVCTRRKTALWPSSPTLLVTHKERYARNDGLLKLDLYASP